MNRTTFIILIVALAILVLFILYRLLRKGTDKVRTAVDKSGKYEAKKQEKVIKAQVEKDIHYFTQKNHAATKEVVAFLKEKGTQKKKAREAANAWNSQVEAYLLDLETYETFIQKNTQLAKLDKETHLANFLGMIASGVIQQPTNIYTFGDIIHNYVPILLRFCKKYQQIYDIHASNQGDIYCPHKIRHEIVKQSVSLL